MLGDDDALDATMINAFLWGLFAAGSLVLGAVIVEIRRPGRELLGLVMAFGAGVLLSAVSFELVDEAVGTGGGTGALIGFFSGAIVFTLGDRMIARIGYANRKDISGDPNDAGALAIVLGAILDGVPESAVLGLTILQTGEVAIAMLVAVFISNIPESLAASATLRASGWSRQKVLLLWGSTALLSAVASALGYVMLDGASADVVSFTLAFAGGAILTMLTTTMIPEAYEDAKRPVGLMTVLGFALAYTITFLSR